MIKAQSNAGFWRRPSSPWDAQLQTLVQRGQKDPCSAQVLSSFGIPGVGFGSRINNLVNEMWLALYANASLAVCDTPFKVRQWEPFFENPLGVAGCKARLCTQELRVAVHQDGPGMWGYSTWMPYYSQLLAKQQRVYMDYLKRFLYPKVFTLKKSVEEQINRTLLAAFAGLRNIKYIAVHIRHGDKWKEATPLPVTTYAEKVKEYIKKTGIKLVYVASDDVKAAPGMQEALGNEGTVVLQPRLDPEAYSYTSLYNATSSAPELCLLTDIMALVRSHVMIGTASSNVGRVVYFLRAPSMITISLDKKGDWLSVGG
jgi:hypothetical protein